MHFLRAAIPITVSAAVLALLARLIDLEVAIRQLISLQPAWLALGILAMVANVVLVSCRYCLVVRDLTSHPTNLMSSFRISLLSLFLTQVLPMPMLADVARGVASWRLLSLSPVQAGLSAFHDRLLARGGVIVSVAIVLPLWPWLNVPLEIALASLCIIGGSILALVIGVVIGRFTHGSRYRVLNLLNQSGRALASHVAGPGPFLRQFGLAVGGILCFAIQLWALSRALVIDLPVAYAVAYAPAIYLAQVLPFVYAGFGAREAVAITVMAGQVDATAAASLGLAVGLTNILVSLPGALMTPQVLKAGQKP